MHGLLYEIIFDNVEDLIVINHWYMKYAFAMTLNFQHDKCRNIF